MLETRTARGVALFLALGLAACFGREGTSAPTVDAGAATDAGVDAGTPPDDAPILDGGHRRDGGSASHARDGGGDDGGIVLPPEVIVVEVRSFDPRRGPKAGGTPIVIVGRGFVPGTRVTFGGAPLVGLAIQSERTITGSTPPGMGGVASVVVENDAGRVEIPGGFSYEDAPRIGGVTPASGPTTGGTELAITGDGFAPDSAVFVGARAALNVRVDARGHLRAVSPPGDVGSASVSVINRGGVATLDGAFAYGRPPSIASLSPVAGPVGGGTIVTLRGAGLANATGVFLGGAVASITAAAEDTLTIVTPASGLAGPVDVAVVTPMGSASMQRGFAYTLATSSLAVFGASPGSGPEAGGVMVTISGAGFGGGVAEVRFGEVVASGVVVDSPTSLRATLPPGSGLVDVSVVAGASTASLPNAFAYDASLRVLGTAPSHGPSAGGTPVLIRGEGFTPSAEVFFGPLPVSPRFVDDTTLAVTTPPAAGGPVDVMVRVAARTATLPAGFVFDEPPHLFRVTPGRGAVAGGTFVRVAGAGFTPRTRVFFNGAAARDVHFVHGGLVTAYTPSGFVGGADILAATEIGATQLDSGFTYFDPLTSGGGTSGGPVAGAVNVSVLNGVTGRPVPRAYATLSTTSASLYGGYTDGNGQVVLSGPDLVGRQTVTVTKEDWSAASIARFDAQNVTLYISPQTGGFGPSPNPGTPPPTIRGTLRSAFKPIPPPPPGFHAAIMVTISAEAYWMADYIPGGQLQILTDDGRQDRTYEITGRFGDQAVYALGGHLSDDSTTFIPYVLGLRRYITIRPTQTVVDGQDVTLDASLTATLDARLVTPPRLLTDGPQVYRMRVYLDLGAEGVLTFFQLPESHAEPRLVQQHLPEIAGATAGTRFLVVVGAYTLVSGYETLPLSEITVENLTDLSQPLQVGPMVSIAGAARPIEGEVLGDFHFGWQYDTPPEASYFQLYLPQQVGQYAGASWSVIVPGSEREVFVPDLQTIVGSGGIPRGANLDWYVSASRVRRFDIDAFDYRDLYDRLGYSFTRFTFESP